MSTLGSCQFNKIRHVTYRVALPSVCAQAALLYVHLAVVRRPLEVDQVRVRVRLEPLEPGKEHPATSALLLLDLVGVVKLLLQNDPDLRKERCQLKNV